MVITCHRAEFIFGDIKIHQLFFWYYDGTHTWNPSSGKACSLGPNTVSTMTDDDLVTQGARLQNHSIDIVPSKYAASAPRGLIFHVVVTHDDVTKWKHFPGYWPFVRGTHWSPVNSPHKGQWSGGLMFSLVCARTNCWVNNRTAGDLRRRRVHYDAYCLPRFSTKGHGERKGIWKFSPRVLSSVRVQWDIRNSKVPGWHLHV